MTRFRLPLLVAVATALLNQSNLASAAEVQTVAGTGENRSFGDGGPATEAGIGEPYGVVIGPDGALYICEITTHVIRRVDLKSGIASTVVGTGKKGNSGDGGPATEARVDEPYEIRFDRAGNLYFVDMKSAVVRRVEHKTGIISTIAGTGEQGFSGDGGPAIKAKLSRPHSITLDHNGSLYICDIGNHRIRRVDLESRTIETFAGTGERKPTPDGAPHQRNTAQRPSRFGFRWTALVSPGPS